MISEWARKTAHQLDFQREAWKSRREASDTIPAETLKLLVSSDLDHAALLSAPYEHRREVHRNAFKDVLLLQRYLSELNATKKIDGVRYNVSVFKSYRLRVIYELQYRQALVSALSLSLKESRIMASGNPARIQISNTETKDPFDLLVIILDVMRRNLHAVYGKEWYSMMPEDDRIAYEKARDVSRVHFSDVAFEP